MNWLHVFLDNLLIGLGLRKVNPAMSSALELHQLLREQGHVGQKNSALLALMRSVEDEIQVRLSKEETAKTMNNFALAVANAGYNLKDLPGLSPEYADFTLTNDEGMQLPMPH